MAIGTRFHYYKYIFLVMDVKRIYLIIIFLKMFRKMTFTTIPEPMDSLTISPNIITDMDRNRFQTELANNRGGLILKFGAEWCSPCKKIDPLVYSFMNGLPENIQGAIIDIDDNFDIYAFLKTKKQVSAVPTLLFYKKGNTTWVPDASLVGADENQIRLFFQNCFRQV
jgi:thioredoxin 1